MTEVPEFRRLIYRHTRGSWAGIDQIVGIATPRGFFFLTTREVKGHEGPAPDKMSVTQMMPDGREAKGLRLKSTDRYVMYQEVEPK